MNRIDLLVLKLPALPFLVVLVGLASWKFLLGQKLF